MKSEVITGNDFIYKFFDLKTLEPDYKKWTADELKGNDSRYYRLLQIEAMLKYLGIESVTDFITGNFTLKRSEEYYDTFLKSAQRYLRSLSQYRQRNQDFKLDNHSLPKAFTEILDYRDKLNKLIYHQSGVMEASGLYLWTYEQINEANFYLERNIIHVNRLLLNFLDCTKVIRMPLGELKENYGYLDINLGMVDADNY
ncbi:MAG: hypothetical protein ACOYN6_00180 [Ignavibacteria bacterium]